MINTIRPAMTFPNTLEPGVTYFPFVATSYLPYVQASIHVVSTGALDPFDFMLLINGDSHLFGGREGETIMSHIVPLEHYNDIQIHRKSTVVLHDLWIEVERRD